MVPLQAILIPLYLLVAQLGWLNSYQALIIPFIANPFLIFLMRQSFMNVPTDLEDAAAIDGAGRIKSFLKVAVPLTMAGIATQAILAGTWTWNSFMIPVTFTTDPNHYMMTVGLNTLQSQFYTLATVQMAGRRVAYGAHSPDVRGLPTPYSAQLRHSWHTGLGSSTDGGKLTWAPGRPLARRRGTVVPGPCRPCRGRRPGCRRNRAVRSARCGRAALSGPRAGQ